MSLLRRRAMMESQEYEANVIYIDAGFLDQNTSTAFSTPKPYQFSEDAWSTTAIEVVPGDAVAFEGTGNLIAYQRIRFYLPDGTYSSYCNGATATVDSGIGYARYCYLSSGQMLTGVTVTHVDGSMTRYTKIIDRR